MIDIAAIKARADKATAGPWELSPHSIGKGGWISGEHGSYTDIVINAGTDRALTNADFIAHARTDIPALIAALEASEAARVKAEQERDALKEALKPFAKIGEYMRHTPEPRTVSIIYNAVEFDGLNSRGSATCKVSVFSTARRALESKP